MANVESKVCSKCKVEKPLDMFHFQGGRRKFLRRADCRACRNLQINARYNPIVARKKRDKFISNNPLYGIWANMKKRCSSPGAPDYYRYGGRGITVCARWMTYKNFEEDMLPSYQRGLTLDRIDNDAGYSPENCRWADGEQQANNTRKVRKISHDGKTMSINQWARYLGIKRSTLSMRLTVYQWPPYKALTTF